jgi:membrane protease YdiL (CAAX protease family)
LLGTIVACFFASAFLLHALGLRTENPIGFCAALLLGLHGPAFLWMRSRARAAGVPLRVYAGALPRPRRFALWGALLLSLYGLSFGEVVLLGKAVRVLDESLFQDLFTLGARPPEPLPVLARGFASALWFATVAWIAPAIEELLFRGVLVDVLTARWGRRKAWLASAALFGVLHPVNAPAAFLLALVQSALRRSSGGLLLPIALHSTYNLALAAPATWRLLTTGQIPGGGIDVPGGVPTALVVLVLSMPLPLFVVRRAWRAD